MNIVPIERGLFTFTSYHIYKSVERISLGEKFIIPCQGKKYHAIDEDGTPQVGSYVKEGDCIIGKMRMDKNTNNVSTYVKPGQEGTVDGVSVWNNNGMTIMTVRIRYVKPPTVGDHWACHYAQIPIVTRVLPEADIPYTKGIDSIP